MQGLYERGGVSVTGCGKVIQSYHGKTARFTRGACSEERFPCCRSDDSVGGELVRGLVCLDRVISVCTKDAVYGERLSVFALIAEGIEDALYSLDLCRYIGVAGGREVCELDGTSRAARGNGPGGFA